MAEVTIRLHGELCALLPRAWRGADLPLTSAERATVKQAIESLGVPHTEIGAVCIDGRPAALTHGLADGEHVDAHPLAPMPRGGAAPRFVADAQLGRLARYLRFLGCDTLHRNAWHDAELVALAAVEGRAVLTRDRALLMRRDVLHGCLVREDDPLAQLRRVARRYGIVAGSADARCLLCNLPLADVPQALVSGALPPAVAERHDRFWHCPGCRRVYWRGTHWQRLQQRVEAATR